MVLAVSSWTLVQTVSSHVLHSTKKVTVYQTHSEHMRAGSQFQDSVLLDEQCSHLD